jgi:A/G-specific adenine glycosylase
VVADAYGGRLPADDGALRSLPGIGAYTARAVRSFAFGHDVAAVDTNGIRVLARCLQGGGLRPADALALGDRLVPPGNAWDFNQAMFDLGATVCRARPECGSCPLQRACRWRRAGLGEPDPWRASPTVRPQSRFDGSDRQGRGRLLAALRRSSVPRAALAGASGWPDDETRAIRVAASLVAEGFCAWSGGRLRLV